MSDFESRVRDALDTGASGAPDAVGLADAARDRARARRRTALVVSAVAVLALVAVPAGVFALRDSADSSGPGIAKDTTSTVPAGWRTETWHDLSVQVPDAFGYGPLSTWCIGNETPGTPVVERPGGVVEMIACTPASGYGVQFFDSMTLSYIGPAGPVRAKGDDYPDGAWIGYEYLDSATAVKVVTADKQTAQEILDSAKLVDGVDANGCAPRETRAEPFASQMSICRYSPDGWLEQSERLTSEETEQALAALQATKIDGRRGPHCRGLRTTGWTVVLATEAQFARVQFGWGCWSDNVVRMDDTPRMLTSDVLYWALSPGWSGGVDGDVPLPTELRR